MSETLTVLTIGHSTHSWEHFIALLQGAGVTALADVRTSPYSRLHAHFNQDELRENLHSGGISYAFLGRELGGRPSERSLYCEGVADYEKMAQSEAFTAGLNRIIKGAERHRIVLMCSERDPLDCHRCLLVGRALAQRGICVNHIQESGKILSHAQIEDRLLEFAGRTTDDLFATRKERLAMAYRERGRKVAFAEPQPQPGGPIAAE